MPVAHFGKGLVKRHSSSGFHGFQTALNASDGIQRIVGDFHKILIWLSWRSRPSFASNNHGLFEYFNSEYEVIEVVIWSPIVATISSSRINFMNDHGGPIVP